MADNAAPPDDPVAPAARTAATAAGPAATDKPEAPLARGRQQGTVRRAVRGLGRDRAAATVTVAVLVVLGIAVVGFGASGHSVLPTLRDIGAWLANDDQGSVTHAGGANADPDARVPLTDAAGHKLTVIQDGNVVLVKDETTGVVSRIDPAQLAVTQAATFSTPNVQIAVGAGQAYVVDPVAGVVQRLDPVRLSLLGVPIGFNSALGVARIDGAGTLWVPVLQAGTVVPVRGDSAGTPVSAGRPGDQLNLTIAAGKPVVTNTAQATVRVLDGNGATVQLASATTPAATLLAPASTDGPVVPMVAPGDGQLVLVDTTAGAASTVALSSGTDDLGPPQTLGTRVYVPDNTSGRLLVYDTHAKRLLPAVTVTGRSGQLDVFVKDGVVWANDASGKTAICVDASGGVHHIGKDDPGLPGGASPTHHRTPKAGNTTGGGNGGGGGGGGGGTPAALPAGGVTEQSQAGSILVTFAPPSGASPQSYTLAGVPAGAAVAPASVPAKGQPYQFVVNGLDCAKQYQFSVVANYATKHPQSTSDTAKRPCVAPDKPQNVGLDTGTQHQIRVSWTAPASDGGGTLTYQVSLGSATQSVSGDSATFTGLTNFVGYSASVVAVSSAGSSGAASQSKTLAAGPWSGTIYNNAVFAVNLRSGPGTNYTSIGSFAAPGGEHVTVYCVKPGGSWQDPSGSPAGSTWYQLSNPAGYVATGYVNTSGVWDCT
jgi:hypothetical protein